jgi:hypothetical protein
LKLGLNTSEGLNTSAAEYSDRRYPGVPSN